MTYFPVFKALTEAANPDLADAQAESKVTVMADPEPVLVPVQPDRHVKSTSPAPATSPSSYWRSNSVSYDNVAGACRLHGRDQDR